MKKTHENTVGQASVLPLPRVETFQTVVPSPIPFVTED